MISLLHLDDKQERWATSYAFASCCVFPSSKTWRACFTGLERDICFVTQYFNKRSIAIRYNRLRHNARKSSSSAALESLVNFLIYIIYNREEWYIYIRLKIFVIKKHTLFSNVLLKILSLFQGKISSKFLLLFPFKMLICAHLDFNRKHIFLQRLIVFVENHIKDMQRI